MQRRHEDGKRPRVSVSLSPEDFAWVQSFNGPSDSFTVSRIVTAARLAGLDLDDAKSGGVIEDLADWLSRKRQKTKLATELAELLNEFVRRK